MLCIVKEAPSFLQNQLQLHQLTVAALQTFAVAIDLKELTLQLIQLSLLQTTAFFITCQPCNTYDRAKKHPPPPTSYYEARSISFR